MPMFRSRTVPQEARQFDGTEECYFKLSDWSDGAVQAFERGKIRVVTPEDAAYETVEAGGWVIRGLDGDFWVMDNEQFEKIFEPEPDITEHLDRCNKLLAGWNTAQDQAARALKRCEDLTDMGRQACKIAESRGTALEAAQKGLAFATSVIRGGESWSPTCDEVISGSLKTVTTELYGEAREKKHG